MTQSEVVIAQADTNNYTEVEKKASFTAVEGTANSSNPLGNAANISSMDGNMSSMNMTQ